MMSPFSNPICDDSRIQPLEHACARLVEAIGIAIEKMQFVGGQSPDKDYCTIIICLEKEEDTDILPQRQTVEADGDMAPNQDLRETQMTPAVLQLPEIQT